MRQCNGFQYRTAAEKLSLFLKQFCADTRLLKCLGTLHTAETVRARIWSAFHFLHVFRWRCDHTWPLHRLIRLRVIEMMSQDIDIWKDFDGKFGYDGFLRAVSISLSQVSIGHGHFLLAVQAL